MILHPQLGCCLLAVKCLIDVLKPPVICPYLGSEAGSDRCITPVGARLYYIYKKGCIIGGNAKQHAIQTAGDGC